LLMHYQGTHTVPPLQGVSLMKLVKSEDHQRLQDLVTRELTAARADAGTQVPVAQTLHINMRDAFNIPVPVEVFCSCSQGAEGGGIGPLQFLLGIREQEAHHVQESSHANDLGLTHGQAITTQQLEQISESNTSGSDSDMSSESSQLHLTMSAWVDVDSGRLTLLRCSPRLVLLLRRPTLEGEGLLDWVEEEQREGFVVWLQNVAETRIAATRRTMALRLPRCQHGKERCGGQPHKRHFICTASVCAEDLPDSGDMSQVRAVRLDLLEKKKARQGPSRRHQSRPIDVLLWVDTPRKSILRSQHAPRLMFQKGSRIISDDENRLFTAIATQAFHWLADDDWSDPVSHRDKPEPCVLGTYTLTSGGYQLHTEISMLNCGDRWEGTDREWCKLKLSKVRFSEAKQTGGSCML